MKKFLVDMYVLIDVNDDDGLEALCAFLWMIFFGICVPGLYAWYTK